MKRKLTLTRFEAFEVPYKHSNGIRIKVVASEPVNMDAYVFLFLRGPLNPHTDERLDYFHKICSPYDIATYPIGEPIEATPYPYFRLSEVELDYISTADANEAWLAMVALTQNLCDGLTRLDSLTETEAIVVGDATAVEVGSESESSSDSVSA